MCLTPNLSEDPYDHEQLLLRSPGPSMHWALRIALGSVFLYHGITKFPVLSGMAEMMGMPVFVVGLLAAVETLAGALIVLGDWLPAWTTRLGGALIVPVMLGALFMVHLPNGWNSVSMDQGMEFQFTLLMIALYFLFVGNLKPGSASVESGS